MKLRFTYFDSETGEADTIDFDANITALHPNAGPIIAQAFSTALSKMTGDEEVDVMFESLIVCGDKAALTFREKVVHVGGRHSYDILITGLVYSNFR